MVKTLKDKQDERYTLVTRYFDEEEIHSDELIDTILNILGSKFFAVSPRYRGKYGGEWLSEIDEMRIYIPVEELSDVQIKVATENAIRLLVKKLEKVGFSVNVNGDEFVAESPDYPLPVTYSGGEVEESSIDCSIESLQVFMVSINPSTIDVVGKNSKEVRKWVEKQGLSLWQIDVESDRPADIEECEEYNVKKKPTQI